MLAGLPVAKDKRGCIVVEPTMRCPGQAEVWALGDCASIPGPDGKPYPPLAQHALRQAKVLAENIHRVLTGQPPQPYVHESLGMMGSLGHYMGFAQFLKLRMHGFPAWFIRRTYYLLQMPGWSRRLRMMIDWTFGLLFRPDIVKVGLDSETALLLRELGWVTQPPRHSEEGEAGTESAIVGSPLARDPSETTSPGVPSGILCPRDTAADAPAYDAAAERLAGLYRDNSKLYESGADAYVRDASPALSI